jgi:predicted N-acetyltransferase YhbS
MKFTIRPLKEDDLPSADIVFRLAFGTLAGLRDPIKYGGDTDYVRTRWLADPNAAFVAKADGKPVGSVFVAKWGSVAIFGPLTVHPNVWDKAVGTRLLEPAMELLDRWGPTHVGLHTVVQSAKHITLFRKFGFWPGCLIEIMAKPVHEAKPDPQMRLFSWGRCRTRVSSSSACSKHARFSPHRGAPRNWLPVSTPPETKPATP